MLERYKVASCFDIVAGVDRALLRLRQRHELLRSACLFVCLYVCLHVCSHVQKSTCPNFYKFSVYILTASVARSSSDDNAIRYVLPVQSSLLGGSTGGQFAVYMVAGSFIFVSVTLSPLESTFGERELLRLEIVDFLHRRIQRTYTRVPSFEKF